MSKLNINKSEWLELVFEGKNKEYGAYQLRKEDSTTTVKAFVSALVFLTGLAMLPMLLSSFTHTEVVNKPTVILDDSLHITNVQIHKVEPKTVLPKNTTPAKKTPRTQDLTNPVVVDHTVATPVDLTPNVNLGQNTTPTNTNSGGTGPNTGGTGTSNTPVEAPIIDTTIHDNFSVEKNPMFPGGIEEFLKTVGKRFQSPEIDEEKTIRLVVFFVVEKDGSLSNITVPRNPGYDLDKEAIRVLKSIKTKWEPGIYKGQPVRTQYSLPITVKMQ